MMKKYSSPTMEIHVFLPAEKLAWSIEGNNELYSGSSVSNAEIGLTIPTDDWYD